MNDEKPWPFGTPVRVKKTGKVGVVNDYKTPLYNVHFCNVNENVWYESWHPSNELEKVCPNNIYPSSKPPSE